MIRKMVTQKQERTTYRDRCQMLVAMSTDYHLTGIVDGEKHEGIKIMVSKMEKETNITYRNTLKQCGLRREVRVTNESEVDDESVCAWWWNDVRACRVIARELHRRWRTSKEWERSGTHQETTRDDTGWVRKHSIARCSKTMFEPGIATRWAKTTGQGKRCARWKWWGMRRPTKSCRQVKPMAKITDMRVGKKNRVRVEARARERSKYRCQRLCWNQGSENDVCKLPQSDEGRHAGRKEEVIRKGKKATNKERTTYRERCPRWEEVFGFHVQMFKVQRQVMADEMWMKEVNTVEMWESTSSMVKAGHLKSHDVVE